MQINWFESHEKIVFCPKMEAITLLMSDGSTKTYKCSLLNEGRGPTKYVQTLILIIRMFSANLDFCETEIYCQIQVITYDKI